MENGGFGDGAIGMKSALTVIFNLITQVRTYEIKCI